MSAEIDFEEELRLLFDEWDKLEIATARFRSQLDDVGPIETAKEYVRRETPGLGEAYRRLGARGTLEGLILRYSDVFDDETVALAQAKLNKLTAARKGSD